MFTSHFVTRCSNNVDVADLPELDILITGIIGQEARDEFEYVKSDSLLDGIMSPWSTDWWDSDDNAWHTIYYHEKAEHVTKFQSIYFKNEILKAADAKLREHGWSVEATPGNTPIIDENALFRNIDTIERIRPSRRHEFDSYLEKYFNE